MCNLYVWSTQIFNISEPQYFINLSVRNGVCKKYSSHMLLLQACDILVKYLLGVYNSFNTVRAQQYPICRNIVKLNKYLGNMF
jgi:hypothetical protein